MKNKKPLTGLLLLLLLATAVPAAAQTISLPAAIDSAMKQNPSVQAAVLRSRVAKAEEKTAWNLPYTSATAEFGQINSAAHDTRFGISQEVAFPLIYKREKQMLQSGTGVALETEAQVRLETRKQVTLLYYRMLVTLEKKKLLLYTDSIFAGFLQRQEERFKAGDANILEKTSAELQRQQVANQLVALDADLLVLQLDLAQLMNTKTLYLPEAAAVRMPSPALPDTSVLARYPAIRMMRMQEDVAWRNYRLTRARMLPSLSFGYFNQSIAGWQNITGTDMYYGPGYRFSSWSVGLSFPLFFNSGVAGSRAAHLSWEMRRMETADLLRRKKTELEQLHVRYGKNLRTLGYYENSALQQAGVLTANADLQLRNGDISFLEWMMLVNQAVGIRGAYLDAVEEWNETVIELNSHN